MSIYDYEARFGASDKTTKAMKSAVADWFDLYYAGQEKNHADPCQRIAYTVVSKLVRAVFGEYGVSAPEDITKAVIAPLNQVRELAMALALVGGECYIKPWVGAKSFEFTVIPRDGVLIFSRDPAGEPTDVGTIERSTLGNAWYTLLERRRVDEKGYLTIENRLYRSFNENALGTAVSLGEHPLYEELADSYTYEVPVGSVGLIRLATPMLNCVDGSKDGVSVYAAAAGLIHAMDQNEYQLSGECQRGQSRVFVSSDLLDGGSLQDNLFLGLDEEPERLGITLFSPQLREQSFLNRKQEYLRNVESLIGIKRGLLCDANEDQRTATEISASQTDHALTVMDFQNMWQAGLEKITALCVILGSIYGIPLTEGEITVDWGNGVLFDEEKRWQDYKEMVSMGLCAPEVALGWRFGLPCNTPEERKAIRQKFMEG